MVSIFFMSVVITILLTPGPTNTLLAASGIQIGIQKSLKLIPAEVLGYVIAISVWGVLIKAMSGSMPWLPVVLKLLSAAFILVLAVRLWKTSTKPLDLEQPTIAPKALFVATLFNPKAFMFATLVFPEHSWLVVQQFVLHMGTFVMLIIPIAFLWIAFGYLLVKNRISWLNQCNLQRFASLILVFFSIPLTISALSSL
ncbi:MAG: LysE family translocator [Acinetobacter sp.]|nr:MAG: LysE family translocator [Acinetobacter sp.]